MATQVHIRRLNKSWQYDFKLPDHDRERKGGYRTKAAAYTAGKKKMDELETGACRITLAEAYEKYMAATTMKDRARDTYQHHWSRIGPSLGHLYIVDIDTASLDRFKQQLPTNLGPSSVNHHLTLISAILHFMWMRGKLKYPPYIPTEKVPQKHQDWYTQEERDQLLEGMFSTYPQWYLFFYITCRLGLRRGEVYAISRRKIRDIPRQLIVDEQVQRGTKTREAKLVPRKNNKAYTLELSADLLDAINWHISQGYAGEDFLFSKTGEFPRYLDSHVRPLQTVQQKLGLRMLSHHVIGRHSVASQAVTEGEEIKAVQAQLGHRSPESTHRYAHLGSKAQLHVMEKLAPAAPPHAKNKVS
jgi:integrase